MHEGKLILVQGFSIVNQLYSQWNNIRVNNFVLLLSSVNISVNLLILYKLLLYR